MRRIDEATRLKVLEEYREGYSKNEIARRLRISRAVTGRVIRAAGAKRLLMSPTTPPDRRGLTYSEVARRIQDLPSFEGVDLGRHVCEPYGGVRQARVACARRFARAQATRERSFSLCIGCKEGRLNLIAAAAAERREDAESNTD